MHPFLQIHFEFNIQFVEVYFLEPLDTEVTKYQTKKNKQD